MGSVRPGVPRRAGHVIIDEDGNALKNQAPAGGSPIAINTWPRDQYSGPGGGLSTGPGSGLYAGPCDRPYRSNRPPLEYLRAHLINSGLRDILDILERAGGTGSISTEQAFGR